MGRKPLPIEKVRLIRNLASQGKTPKEIAETLNLSLSTIYRYLRAHPKTKKQEEPQRKNHGVDYKKLFLEYMKENQELRRENAQLRRENAFLRTELLKKEIEEAIAEAFKDWTRKR